MKKLWDGLVKYIQGVRSELKRVTWPSPEEANRAVGAVLALVAIIGAYVFILDTIILAIWRALGIGTPPTAPSETATGTPSSGTATTGK